MVSIWHHFARKGVCGADRITELAQQAGVDMRVTVVFGLAVGGDPWTDLVHEECSKPRHGLLERGNIAHCGSLPNDHVQTLLRAAHFCLSPTFGYSAFEAIANYRPMIPTRQAALLEFIEDNTKGILLNLPVDSDDHWIYSSRRTGLRRVSSGCLPMKSSVWPIPR